MTARRPICTLPLVSPAALAVTPRVAGGPASVAGGEHGLRDKKWMAAKLGITVRGLHNLILRGKIGPRRIRLGSAVRFDTREVESWIAAGCPDGAAWSARLRKDE